MRRDGRARVHPLRLVHPDARRLWAAACPATGNDVRPGRCRQAAGLAGQRLADEAAQPVISRGSHGTVGIRGTGGPEAVGRRVNQLFMRGRSPLEGIGRYADDIRSQAEEI